MAYRVVICDDNKNMRAFLRMILTTRRGMEIAGEGGSGSDAVRLCRECSPDLLLVDVQMDTRSDGIDAIESIRTFDKHIKIIVLTVYGDDDFVIGSFVNGADNFILKDQPHDEILSIIDDTLEGREDVSPIVAGKLKNYVVRDGLRRREQSKQHTECMRVLSLLTKTELEILLLLHQGLSREEISQKKVVEPGTVKTHISNILKKLKRHRTSALIEELERIGFFEQINSTAD